MVVSVVRFFPPDSQGVTQQIAGLTDTENLLFFFGENNVIRSDGTEAGTFEVLTEASSIVPNPVEAPDVAVVNNNLFFSNFNDENGNEPWISDGTAEGTTILKDINPDGESTPLDFLAVGDKVFFTADDGVNSRELWVSDGTAEGTQLTRNIQDVESPINQSFENFVDFNGTLFFERKLLPISDVGLWKSDGTEEGTELVKTFEEDRDLDHLTVIDDTLFFTRNDPEGQLWRSDGTTEGTVLIADGLGIAGNIEEVLAVGDTLFFNVSDEEVGDELWKSDGTTEGTQLVKDIRPGEQQSGSTINLGSIPRNLIDVDGTLFFTAYDGNATGLWKSDGTAEGTQLVRNFVEGSDSNAAFRDFAEVDGTLYFNFFLDSVTSLWKSDGTAEGTVQIEPEEIDLAENVVDSFRFRDSDREIAEFDDQLFFSGEAFDENEGEYVPALLTLSDSDENGQGSVEEQPDSEDGDITGTTVYRFFNNNSGVHFYTANEAERDAVQELSNFNFEGGSYLGVDPLTGQPEPVPVYRFLNQDTGVHLYTTSEIEREAVQELDNFSFEGEAFFAYESEVEGSIPIYRFFNATSGAHFYTPSAGERDNVEESLPEFQSEGIAYYALPLPE